MRSEPTKLIAVAALLAFAGCDKTEPAQPAEAALTTGTANTGASGAGTVAHEPPAAPAGEEYATFEDTDWCPRAHDDTVKIVEGMKKTMKFAGKDAGADDEFAPPEKARYLELCGKLPLQMQKCLVVGWAAKNRDACQKSLDGLGPDEKAAYTELMGK